MCLWGGRTPLPPSVRSWVLICSRCHRRCRLLLVDCCAIVAAAIAVAITTTAAIAVAIAVAIAAAAAIVINSAAIAVVIAATAAIAVAIAADDLSLLRPDP